MKGTILLVTSFRDGVLHYGLLTDRIFIEHAQNIDHLDMDLLQLIDTICDESPLSGIMVDRTAIHGFASIRLLLTTFNFIAWIRDVPILSIDDYPTVRKNASFVDGVLDTIHNDPHFTKQLLPDYSAPADITTSKRSHKFTLLR